MPKKIDMTNWVMKEHGVKDSKIKIIKEYGKDSGGHITWECICDCGNKFVAIGSDIRKGHTKSCGCKRQIDLKGKQVGKLKVLEKTNEIDNNGNIKWKCLCECGNITIVSSHDLSLEKTLSCGCLNSKGEQKIISLLQENNISFKKEKVYNDCIFPNSKKPSRFDFCIEDNYLIEYDGIQHFSYTNTGWDTEEKYKLRILQDKYKTKYCKDNNIPLIRIPYTHLSDIKIEDLLLETTNWRVV